MSILQKTYDISPVFFQNLMTSVSGFIKNRSRYGKTYYEYREFLKKFDNYTLDTKLKFQQEELKKFVQYTYEQSVFYREFYKHIEINNITTLEDLEELPILDKEMVRENIKDINTVVKNNAVTAHTGGTTGKSLEVFYTKDDMMKRMAQLDHFKARVGFENLKMRRATFSGNHIIPQNQKKNIYWRFNRASKQMLYSSFNLTEKNMKFYIESLNKYKPHAIDGFFTSMLDIANYIERNNIKLDFIPVAIFPTSETLTTSGREQLERVFRCKVYNQYASSEGAPFITECKYQNLHIELNSGVFEHFESDSDEILVTSFTTHGTPLIRYRIGDSIAFSQEERKCGCGLGTPIIKEIHGRKLEFLYTSDGAKINGGNIANIFKNIPNAIIRAQLIQNKMDEILVFIEIDKQVYKLEYDAQLKQEMKYKFGKKTKIIIEHVDEIPREKSGKFQMIKNNVMNK